MRKAVALLALLLHATAAFGDDGARLVVRPDASTVVENTRVSFFCRADGNPLPSVQWKANGKSIGDSRFVTKSLPNGLSTLRIEPVRLEDNNTVISCSADNGVSNPVVAEAVLTVITQAVIPSGFPEIEAHPGLKSVEHGRTAHVTCRVKGEPRPKVLWLRDLVPIDIRAEGRYSVSTLGNPGALMIQQAREEDQGKYECVARNSHGVVHSKAAHLYVKVRRVPPYFSYKLEKVYKVGTGGNVNLTCVAVGYPMPRVFWKKSDDVMLDDPATAPIGRNVLTLTNVEQTENYTCIAVSKLGNIEATTTVEVKALPPAPKSLSIDSVTPDSVTLKWTKVELRTEPVTSYLVKYCQKYIDSSQFKQREVPAEQTTVTIGDLQPHQLYEFHVISVNTIGPGPRSLPKEAQTGETAPASAPLNVQSRSLNRDSILVKWQPCEKPNGVITGYKVYYTNQDASTPLPQWQTYSTKSDELMATVYSLEPESVYSVRVQARTAKGSGPMSETARVTTRQGVPGQPISLSLKPVDSRRVVLAWEKPLFSLPIVGYTVRHNASDGDREFTLTSPHEKHTIMGLEPNTLYAFSVAAQSARGQGEFSLPLIGRTQPSTPAGPPTLLSLSPSSSRSIRAKWLPPDASLQHGAIVHYRIRWRFAVDVQNPSSYSDEEDEDSGTTEAPWQERTLPNGTEGEVGELRPWTEYEVSVAAGTEKGFGPESGVQRVRTSEDVPSAPRNLQVVLVSSNEVKLTWERPEADNGRLMGYYVYKEKLLNGSPVHGKLQKEISIMDPQKMSHEIRDLEPNTEYAFRVNAFNRNGDGEFSESRRVLTGGIPPRQPEMQSVVLLNDEAPIQARVEWKRPQLAPLEAPIDRFNVWYRPEGAASFQKKTVNGTETSAVLDDLWMGRVYEIVVSAESEEGASANATEQLVTPVGAPDSEPINVQYEIGQGKMRVSWDAPVESRRNGNITSYLAILTPMDAEGKRIEHQVKDGTSTSFKVEPRTSYTFKVSASTMKGSGPFSPVLTINPDPAALVGPPTNVRVEATSNSSAVIQWDFEGGQVDGFVVKYMHEPGSRTDTERWTARTVMNTGARHLEVPHLTAHKPYAFCVLAIRQNRQGSCSDPPTLISSLQPTYMVSELVVEWKTASSVKLRWQYDGPKPVGFYLNHTGKKEYFDHNMALKTMASPGFRHELDGAARDYLWTNLRPYMQYTFHVGVRSLPPGGRQYWPKEVVVVTDATGPPFVEVPVLEDIGPRAGQAQFKLRPASEEYGPISHYWLIIVPGNYSKDDMMNVEPSSLEQATHSRREQLAKQLSIQPAKKVKKDLREDDDEEDDEDSGFEEEEKMKGEEKKTRGKRSVGKLSRHRRSVPQGAYVAARIQAEDMRQMFKNDAMFTVGDEKMYHGFTNFPLEPSSKYKVMMRAFAKNDPRRRGDFDQRPPMTEKMSRLYSDSELSEPFTTRAALKAGARSGSAWLLGPLVALFIIAILIGMLVCWWLRCNKKSAGRNHRHGSITKVALNGSMVNNGGMASETSKLLSSDNYGRTVMNPYEQLNGNCAESSLDLYPMMPAQPQLSQQQQQQRYAVPVAVPCLPHAVSVGGGTQMTHPAIPISELAHQIERMRMNNNAGFQQEFESIETGQHFTWEHSSAEANRHKNRYANVVAYDHSRVTLTNLDGLPESDYINANYIDGYDKPKAYIATQGPLCETFADFWRMVWEEGSMTIVMLTNLEERSRVKCDQYWPTRGSSTYGDIQVTLLETTVLAHYTLRVLRVQVAGESEVRDVRHLQYTAWPDHGVPDHPTPFLVFLKRVKTLNPPEAGPIITHCSAGIGRTGALIAIDCQLERLRYENTVDVCGCVTRLRAMRSYMVQTEEQYIFIYDAVLDAVNSGSTEVPAGKLYHHVQALMQIQPIENISAIEMEFRHLSTLKSLNSRCAVANLPANRNKNRQVNMVPYDSNRVIMQMIPGVDGSDYINASWVDGYRERSAYICTQSPTQQTAADLWRMVWEHEAAIVVMLTKVWEQNREKCCEYWPSESGAQVGQLVVEPIAEYNMPQYVLREFRLSDVQTGQSRTVRHFQYMEWPEVGAPKNAEMFIDFVQQVHRTKSQFGVDGPMVVHCYSGAGRSGVFVALAHLMDRMRIEHVVDVFTTVKLLRTERQNMVQDKEHYQFLYQAALEFLASYDQMIN